MAGKKRGAENPIGFRDFDGFGASQASKIEV
jgi:hypothetical protein